MKELYTKEDAERFIKGEFDAEAITYLIDEALPSQQDCDFRHVLSCLKSMVAQLFGFHPAGDFGQAVLRNDLFDAVGRADDKNILCLNLYTKFLYNKVPASLLQEARRSLEYI